MELKGTIDLGVKNAELKDLAVIVEPKETFCYYCNKSLMVKDEITDLLVSLPAMTLTDENEKREICVACVIKVFDEVLAPDPQ